MSCQGDELAAFSFSTLCFLVHLYRRQLQQHPLEYTKVMTRDIKAVTGADFSLHDLRSRMVAMATKHMIPPALYNAHGSWRPEGGKDGSGQTVGKNYQQKSPTMSSIVAMVNAGVESTDPINNHFNMRLTQRVPSSWLDAVLPGFYPTYHLIRSPEYMSDMLKLADKLPAATRKLALRRLKDQRTTDIALFEVVDWGLCSFFLQLPLILERFPNYKIASHITALQPILQSPDYASFARSVIYLQRCTEYIVKSPVPMTAYQHLTTPLSTINLFGRQYQQQRLFNALSGLPNLGALHSFSSPPSQLTFADLGFLHSISSPSFQQLQPGLPAPSSGQKRPYSELPVNVLIARKKRGVSFLDMVETWQQVNDAYSTRPERATNSAEHSNRTAGEALAAFEVLEGFVPNITVKLDNFIRTHSITIPAFERLLSNIVKASRSPASTRLSQKEYKGLSAASVLAHLGVDARAVLEACQEVDRAK